MKTFKIKKIEPVTILPKLRDYKLNQKFSNAADAGKPVMLTQKPMYLQPQAHPFSQNHGAGSPPSTASIVTPSSNMPQNPASSSYGAASSPEDYLPNATQFSSHSPALKLCESLLKTGFFETFEDFFCTHESNFMSGTESELTAITDELRDAEETKAKGKELESIHKILELGGKLLSVGKFGVAKYLFEKAARRSEEYGEEGGKGGWLELFQKARLGQWECLIVEGRKEEGIRLLEAASEKGGEESLPRTRIVEKLIEIYQRTGEEAEERGAFELTQNYYDKCARMCEEIHNEEIRMKVLLRKAQLLLKMRDHAAAIELASRCLAEAKNLSRQAQIATHRLLAEAFHTAGDLEEAAIHYKTFHEMLRGDESDAVHEAKTQAAAGLGALYWQKNNRKESLRYFHENFEECLAHARSHRQLNHARTVLGLAKGIDTLDDFNAMLVDSQLKLKDLLDFKKHKKLPSSN